MVNLENYEEYMLLEADGELTEAEQEALHIFIDQHPELKSEMELFTSLKLEPDTSILYEHKEELLKTPTGSGKRAIRLGSWWTYGAVAACLALAIVLLRKPDSVEPVSTIVRTTNPVKSDTKTTAGEDLHSTPGNPVAIENKQEQPRETLVRTRNKPKEDIKKYVAEPAAPIEEKIAKAPVDTVTNIEVEPIQEKKNQGYAQGPELEIPAQPQPVLEEKAKQKLIAFAPVQEKFEGFTEIKDAVNEKVEKVKNITSRIKDTDIQFRFGNKELTVRL